MDESRKQFEEWYKNTYCMVGDDFERLNGKYRIKTVRLMWEAWTASSAAIEIELPPSVDGSNVPFAGNAWNAYRDEAVKAIRAAGIKVKE